MKEDKELKTKEEEQPEEGASTEPSEEEILEKYEDFERSDFIEQLEDKSEDIEDLEQRNEELKDTVLRKSAELDNYRKRVQRERSQIYNSAKVNALEDFLDISDDLRRTLDASDESAASDSFLEGVTLLAEKFEEVLQKHGVERINKVMVPFDVDLHDALMRQEPEDDSVESDTVLKIVENGYKIDDRVVRHAKVIVSE